MLFDMSADLLKNSLIQASFPCYLNPSETSPERDGNISSPTSLTVFRRSGTTFINLHNLQLKRLECQCRTDASQNTVMKGFRGFLIFSDMEVLTQALIGGVGEVGVKMLGILLVANIFREADGEGQADMRRTVEIDFDKDTGVSSLRRRV